MSCNVAEYVVGWICMVYNMVKNGGFISNLLIWYITAIHGHMDEPTIAIGNNATHFNSHENLNEDANVIGKQGTDS